MFKKIKIIIALCIFVVLSGIGFGVIRTVVISQRNAAVIIEQEREIKTAYAQVNQAFLLVNNLNRVGLRVNIEAEGEFRPFPEVDPERNRFGIASDFYWLLLMYEIETGNTLAYETVVDYFSQKYEPDGSLRLHNNGKHPEINAFVEWMWEESRWWFDFRHFISSLSAGLHAYSRLNPDSGFERPRLHALSPQMLRELARVLRYYPEITEADIDLTSLQKAGY